MNRTRGAMKRVSTNICCLLLLAGCKIDQSNDGDSTDPVTVLPDASSGESDAASSSSAQDSATVPPDGGKQVQQDCSALLQDSSLSPQDGAVLQHDSAASLRDGASQEPNAAAPDANAPVEHPDADVVKPNVENCSTQLTEQSCLGLNPPATEWSRYLCRWSTIVTVDRECGVQRTEERCVAAYAYADTYVNSNGCHEGQLGSSGGDSHVVHYRDAPDGFEVLSDLAGFLLRIPEEADGEWTWCSNFSSHDLPPACHCACKEGFPE